MAKRKGTVSKIGKSKYSYFIQLDGDQHYFNTKYDPKCGVGDIVGVEFEQKGEQRSQIKQIKVLEDNGAPKGYQEGEKFSAGGGGSSNSGGGYETGPNRQDSIVYQSSRKDALQMVQILLGEDLIKIPTGDKGRIVVEELVKEFTASFFKDASNPTAALKGAEEVEADTAPEKANPAESEWDDGDVDDDEWS